MKGLNKKAGWENMKNKLSRTAWILIIILVIVLIQVIMALWISGAIMD